MTERIAPAVVPTEDIEDKLLEVDGDIRVKYRNKPVNAIAAAAEKELARIGVTLPEGELFAYATAVSLNVAYEFSPVP